MKFDIVGLHCRMTEALHKDVGCTLDDSDDFLYSVCKQHRFNFMLWHEEDKARNPAATDSILAATKRRIDELNGSRNDAIEKLDMLLVMRLTDSGVILPEDTPMNTETPGSAIDRLSILSLRIYHLVEQLHTDTNEEIRREIEYRLRVLDRQLVDLDTSLQTLFDDLTNGRKQLKIYRQFKLYNDPRFNPYLRKSLKS